MPSFKPVGDTPDKSADSISPDEIITASIRSHNIKSVKIDHTNRVDTHQAAKLKSNDGINYTNVKKTFQNQENSAHNRFKLHELARGNMSVEQEEAIRIEKEVQKRLKHVFAQMEKQVREAAYQDGFAVGLKDGKAEILQQLSPAIEHFTHLVNELDGAARNVVTANEEFIFRIINQIVKKIVMREVAEDRDYIKRAVTVILDQIGTRENIKVFVAPELISETEKIKGELVASLGQLRNLTVEPDPRIKIGGCRVETEFGTVDASIGAQLNNAAEMLKGMSG